MRTILNLLRAISWMLFRWPPAGGSRAHHAAGQAAALTEEELLQIRTGAEAADLAAQIKPMSPKQRLLALQQLQYCNPELASAVRSVLADLDKGQVQRDRRAVSQLLELMGDGERPVTAKVHPQEGPVPLRIDRLADEHTVPGAITLPILSIHEAKPDPEARYTSGVDSRPSAMACFLAPAHTSQEAWDTFVDEQVAIAAEDNISKKGQLQLRKRLGEVEKEIKRKRGELV